MKTIRAVVAALFALSAILILSGHQAGARQDPYTGPIFGDLTITGTGSPGSTLLLSGDGFAPDSDITLLITDSGTGEMAREGEAVAGPDGSVSVEVEIDGDFLGNYTAALKGQTVDGSTLELAGAFLVAPDPEPTAVVVPTEPPTEEAPTARPGSDAEVAGATVTNDTPEAPAGVQDDGEVADEQATALPGDDAGSSGGRTLLTWLAALVALGAGAGLWWRGRTAPNH